MSNLIIFSLFLRLFVHVHCGTKTTFPRRFSLLLAIGICLLLVLVLVVLLVFRMRKRAARQKHGVVSRRLNKHELSPVLFGANEIDTIQTVGAPSELPDEHDELKTII